MSSANPLKRDIAPAMASQWISANAGSGKTYALTRQVVKLLLHGVPPERICCITYTKAAAGEMRARITQLLRRLLLLPEAECRAELRRILEEEPSDAMMQRARLLFGMVVDSASGGIQLTTIHGFCQQLLRAFPLEAQLSPHFTVADEAETAQLVAQVKHRLLGGGAAIHGPLAEAIALLAARSGEMRFDALVKAILADRERWRDAWRGQTEASYRARLFAMAGAEENVTPEGLTNQAMGYVGEADMAHLRGCLPGMLAEKTQYKRTLGEGLSYWLALPREAWGAWADGWRNLWYTDGGWGTPRSFLTKWRDGMTDATLAAFITRSMEQVAWLNDRLSALALAEESFALAVLAQQLIALYDQLKAERGLLDYADLITHTRRLLTTGSMVGWVMSKLDHRIDHLLIDEAQDTSAEQWAIAQALVEELVATTGGMGSGSLPRSLFVVGDEKQSIFSFQGADPALYASRQAHFAGLLEHTAAPLAPRALLASYRSAPAILALADALAQEEPIARSLSAAGGPTTHEVARKAAQGVLAGQVVLHPPLPAPEKIAAEAFVMPTAYSITRSAAQLLAEQVATQVAAWIAQGTWAAGDILILTRNRYPIVLPLLRALQRAGVAVAGIDRLVLSDHLAVRDVLALMQWIAAPHDDLALAQVLRSPLMGWSEERLYALAQPRGGVSLWLALQEAGEASALAAHAAHASATPYDFLTQLLEVGGARVRFAERFGEEVHEILDELKEQAANLPATMAPTLANFSRFIGESDRQIKREMEQEGAQVRVMTVHGSKGLEAPLVLLVDTASMPNPGKELLLGARDGQGQPFPLIALSDEARVAACWQRACEAQGAAQLAEHYRLLYVAATRPRDALHVFAAPSARAMAEGCWYEALRRAMQRLGATECDGALVYEDAGFAAQASHAPEAPPTAMPPWLSPVAGRAAVATLSPSRLQEHALEPFRAPRGGAARERGVRIHRVLQFLRADSTREEVAGLLAHYAPDWNDTQRAQVLDEIWALFSQHGWLWQHTRLSEVNVSGTVVMHGTPQPVFGQIDLLVETPDFVAVIDYKTGRDVPEKPSETSPAYLLQLKLYCALLETLYPGKTVRPAIVWTHRAALHWLDAEVASIHWGDTQP